MQEAADLRTGLTSLIADVATAGKDAALVCAAGAIGGEGSAEETASPAPVAGTAIEAAAFADAPTSLFDAENENDAAVSAFGSAADDAARSELKPNPVIAKKGWVAAFAASLPLLPLVKLNPGAGNEAEDVSETKDAVAGALKSTVSGESASAGNDVASSAIDEASPPCKRGTK